MMIILFGRARTHTHTCTFLVVQLKLHYFGMICLIIVGPGHFMSDEQKKEIPLQG